MPSPDYITCHECTVPVTSFVVLETGSCIICLPPSSLIIHDEQSIHESYSEQTNSSPSNAVAVPFDAMVALKWNTPDGVVRYRPLKQIKNWYNFLVPIDDQDKTTCCTSIDHRLLFMGKTSGLIEVYRIQRNRNTPVGIDLVKRYLPFIAHRSPITCLHANRPFSLLISASADGMLTLWDTNRYVYSQTAPARLLKVIQIKGE
jgi:WD40 repeat protein